MTQPTIRLGALDPVRDLTYVKDTVQGFINVAESEQAIGQTVNVGFGEGISIGALAETILELMGSEKRIVQDEERMRPNTSEVYTLICDNTQGAGAVRLGAALLLERGAQRDHRLRLQAPEHLQTGPVRPMRCRPCRR